MVFSTFKNYYCPKEATLWLAWDPTFEHRDISQASSEEIIDIQEAAVTYAPPSVISERLNTILTLEIYQELIKDELDEYYLKYKDFVIIKNDSSRVIYHKDFPNWLIKIGKNATRSLLLEASIKAGQALKSGKKEDAWFPLKNQNLLRAAGKAYFVSHLDPSKADDFEFPQEYIYTCPHAKIDAPAHQKYFSISERKEVYTGLETLGILKRQPIERQKETAKKVVEFIKDTGMSDFHEDNLVLSKENPCRFVMIDTEPLGIFIDCTDTGAHLLNSQESVLLGLIHFRDYFCRANGLTAMAEEADLAIVDYLKDKSMEVKKEKMYIDPLPTTSFRKVRTGILIGISILLPIIPLILLICAVFNACCTSPSPLNQYANVYYTPGLNSCRDSTP